MKKLVVLLCTVATVALSARDLVNVEVAIPTIVIDLKYATDDNFVRQPVYEFNTCYLLDMVVDALAQVQQELALHGLGLKIWDGFRTMRAQIKFWQVCPDPRYVSNPYTEMGRHTRGTAVDLTLVDLRTGDELEMPTLFDDFSERAMPDNQECSAQALKNRSLLQQVMKKYGFSNNKTEWWHFDYQGWQECMPLSHIEPHDEDRITIK